MKFNIFVMAFVSFSFGGAYLESKVAVSELDIWVPGNEKTKEKGHSIE